ncbi:MAG: helix-turn-helix domain-containing protein [Halobacteriota archaeon]
MDSTDTAKAISPRDVVILKVRVAHPTAPVRELSEILEREYGISLSHNRINEILRDLANDGVYRQTMIPDESIFRHYLLRIAFYFPNFADEWYDCYEFLLNDPHILMFFNADSEYHWHAIAQFRTDEHMQRWVHEFFKSHGKLIQEFHNTGLQKVHKFQTDAEVFNDILEETEEGRQYLIDES